MNPLSNPENQAFEQLADLRSNDVYHPAMNAKEVVTTFFPATVSALVLNQSYITSTFYGLMLQYISRLNGASTINAVSNAVISEIGKRKTTELLHRFPDIDRDARASLLILISAIYNSSPEYRFHVTNFSPDLVIVRLSGKDRYHSITHELDISRFLTWPVIAPFLETIAREISPLLSAAVKLIELADNSDCQYEITFKTQKKASADNVTAVSGLATPFLRLPAGKIEAYGNILHASIGNADDFEVNNFSALIRTWLSMEALNAARIYHSATPEYMMESQYRMTRYGTVSDQTMLHITVKSLLQSDKRISIADVTGNDNEPVYKMLFKYYACPEAVFKQKFGHIANPSQSIKAVPPLPQVTRENFHNPYCYNALLHPFYFEHCQGHFVNYPCVPSVVVMQCLLDEATGWLRLIMKTTEKDKVSVESIDMFPERLMMIETAYLISIAVQKISGKRFRFNNIVRAVHDPEIIFVNLVLDLEISE